MIEERTFPVAAFPQGPYLSVPDLLNIPKKFINGIIGFDKTDLLSDSYIRNLQNDYYSLIKLSVAALILWILSVAVIILCSIYLLINRIFISDDKPAKRSEPRKKNSFQDQVPPSKTTSQIIAKRGLKNRFWKGKQKSDNGEQEIQDEGDTNNNYNVANLDDVSSFSTIQEISDMNSYLQPVILPGRNPRASPSSPPVPPLPPRNMQTNQVEQRDEPDYVNYSTPIFCNGAEIVRVNSSIIHNSNSSIPANLFFRQDENPVYANNTSLSAFSLQSPRRSKNSRNLFNEREEVADFQSEVGMSDESDRYEKVTKL